MNQMHANAYDRLVAKGSQVQVRESYNQGRESHIKMEINSKAANLISQMRGPSYVADPAPVITSHAVHQSRSPNWW